MGGGDVTGKRRAGLFEQDDDLDLDGFGPRPPEAAAAAEQVRAVSEAARFRSREPRARAAAGGGRAAAPPSDLAPMRAPRRHRTGRNVQLNIKVRPEDLETFYAIADREGWVLGEVLEHALAALLREQAART
jgi:hypothetical protein